MSDDPFEGFVLQPISPQHELVQSRLEAFYRKIGIAKPAHDGEAYRWFALWKNHVCALVGAVHFRADGSIEVTDLFPVPTRQGVKAGYVALRMLKMLVDKKVIPYWIGCILTENDFGRRHTEKFFGIKPCSMNYVYGGVN